MAELKRILHVANWYPNQWDTVEGIFVKKQYIVFSEVTDAKLINVQVRPGCCLFEYKQINYSENEKGFYILTRLKSYRIVEILTSFLLVWALFKSDFRKYDLLHFHIAYPLLSYYRWWSALIKNPILISEHWTAYHMNFNLPGNTKKLNRVKNIFKHKIPVITVSRALLKDIHTFSNIKDFSACVIPNVVDKVYRPGIHKPSKTTRFFIVNVWREIKNPFSMLAAFSELSNIRADIELRIGGYGELLGEMVTFVKNNNLESKVRFLGKMTQDQIEEQLNKCDAYLFSSKYETFSVACADALSCGRPLIGPPIPCILEYARSGEIITINDDSTGEWAEKILFFIDNKKLFNSYEISKKAKNYFSNNNIQKLYLEFLDENFK